MSATEASSYIEIKKVILRRYDVNEETYRQRFRSARRRDNKAYIEFVADLFRKWTADCDSVTEKLLIEQLLDTVPADLRVWLSEKKPTTGLEAGRIADDYVLARKPKPPVAKGGQDNSPVRLRPGGASREELQELQPRADTE